MHGWVTVPLLRSAVWYDYAEVSIFIGEELPPGLTKPRARDGAQRVGFGLLV
jgi:hypothetical protein